MAKKKLTLKQTKLIANVLSTGNISKGCQKSKASRSYFYRLLRTNQLFRETYEKAIQDIESVYKTHLRLLSEEAVKVLEDGLKDSEEKFKIADKIISHNLKIDELSIMREVQELEVSINELKGEN